MDRTIKTQVRQLLMACFLGFSLGAKGQVELISSDTLRIDSLRVEEIKVDTLGSFERTIGGCQYLFRRKPGSDAVVGTCQRNNFFDGRK